MRDGKRLKTDLLSTPSSTASSSSSSPSTASSSSTSSSASSSSSTGPILICLYAEKGGVSKTTLSGTLAWCMAKRGHRVLLYDCDSQRNLSAWLLGGKIDREFNGNYNDCVHEPMDGDPAPSTNETSDRVDRMQDRTLFNQLEHSRSRTVEVRPARAIQLIPNLWIVPGHKDTTAFDGHISAAEATAEAFPPNRNLSGAPYHAILKTARQVDAQFVLLDMNPSGGALNRCIIMSCDYVVIPTIADFFSSEMVDAVHAKLRSWAPQIQSKRQLFALSLHPFPSANPKFLGYFLSRYRVNKKGGIEHGLVTDTLPANLTNWARVVSRAAVRLSTEPLVGRTQHGSTTWSIHCPRARSVFGQTAELAPAGRSVFTLPCSSTIPGRQTARQAQR